MAVTESRIATENSQGESLPIEGVAPSDAIQPAIRMVVDAKGLAIGILATVASVFALQWAQNFFVPLLVGILLAYTLNPLVSGLERIKVPRMLGTSVVMVAVLSSLVSGVYSLGAQTQSIIEQLPNAASKLSAGLASLRKSQLSNMQRLQSAVKQIERATSQAAGIPSTPKQPTTHVTVDSPSFTLGNFLLTGSIGAVGFIGQAVMVVFLVFFLLLAGDSFKRKLVRISGPSLTNKKITVHILDDINDSIQRYMFMLLTTNMLVGFLAWIAFRWIGLENAAAWGVAAGLLHVVPYLGPALVALAVGMAAFMQFESFTIASLVSGVSLAIATVIGTFFTTWMTGKIAKMNTAAVFISLLFWSWLWGIWGVLLSIPIIVIMKVVSQHVAQLEPVAELLGD